MAVSTTAVQAAWRSRLARYYGIFTICFIIFCFILGGLELFAGLPTAVIGWTFLLLTMGLYATVGILSRTKILDEYYVAGRNVPAIFNGMATGADWMSAASFISMAGTLYALGYDGLAYIMGWTGGYVLLALLFAPYIRKFGQYTIPDFVGARFGGTRARVVAAVAAIIVSFTYVTAQVTGVGLIMSRFVGVPYQWGVVIGLSGVLVCSFLGGMKAVTWTQVAQYIILIIAYLIPVTFLAIKLTGIPIPQLAYGQALQNITALEEAQGITKAYVTPYNEALTNANAITAARGIGLTPPAPITNTDWLGTPWDFLALTLCLMLGTAGLPHILIRFYTVPSVRESRMSVGWALFFIFLLYFTAPAYAAFARWNILQNVVGSQVVVDQGVASFIDRATGQPANWVPQYVRTGLFNINDYSVLEGLSGDSLPAWAKDRIQAGTLVWNDANGDGVVQLGPFAPVDDTTGSAGELSGSSVTAASVDGILQFAELNINNDLIVLSTPEVANLPYTVAAIIAAGGLAAALSTADGLLVVIASAIAHDIYFRTLNPSATPQRRMFLGKSMIVVAAALAALAAMPNLALIARMVAWAFSLAAASFFPIILLGIFWKRANGAGAIAGIIGGLAVTIGYLTMVYINPNLAILGISDASAGIFGIPVNFLLVYIVSKMTAEPSKEIQELVDHLRHPQEDDELMTNLASG